MFMAKTDMSDDIAVRVSRNSCVLVCRASLYILYTLYTLVKQPQELVMFILLCSWERQT